MKKTFILKIETTHFDKQESFNKLPIKSSISEVNFSCFTKMYRYLSTEYKQAKVQGYTIDCNTIIKI